jgi:uncharacterized membrane protein YraQ (UPF0718 family)
MSITYALLDPIMTIMRPFVGFVTAAAAGIAENLFNPDFTNTKIIPDLTCPVDGCCDGVNCLPEVHKHHHTFLEKLRAGFRFAILDLWGDLAAWFFLGLLLAGVITVLIPDDVFSTYLGTGLPAMLLMLAVGIPLYICATASTPIAAALILKGVSPGAALVFLLAGPATNIASMTVLTGVLGKRATAIYLTTISASAVFFGLVVDQIYAWFGLSARAMIGQASELIPMWAGLIGTLIIMFISIKPVFQAIKARLTPAKKEFPLVQIQDNIGLAPVSESCNCNPT